MADVCTMSDSQEHVAAIHHAADIIQAVAHTLKECCTTQDGEWGDDHNTKKAHTYALACAEAAEDAAEAYIALQNERDDLLAALVGLVEEKQPLGINRDTYVTALALVIKHHDGPIEAAELAAEQAA